VRDARGKHDTAARAGHRGGCLGEDDRESGGRGLGYARHVRVNFADVLEVVLADAHETRRVGYGREEIDLGERDRVPGAFALEEIDRVEAVGTPRGVHRGDELCHPARVLGSWYGPEPLSALDDADLVRVRVGEVGGFGGALARERDERDGRRGTGLDDGAGLRGESADAAAMGVMLDRLSGLSS